METRYAYGEALLEIGIRYPEVVVLDADLYRSTRTVLFKEAFPARFFDMGISEADMVSTAAGMAASGLVPYCNSFAIFLSGLCYLQIRTQVAYPSLPVRLVGSSAGITQGPDGATHQSLEDLTLMRGLPNMVVLSPADEIETRQALFGTVMWPGPVYMRLGRYPVPRIFDDSYRFEIGKATLLRDGDDVVIFATGHMVSKALGAADLLARGGVAVRVMNVSTIKPLDVATIRNAIHGMKLQVTIEEHNVVGGLGSAIAECVSEMADRPVLLRLGVRDKFGESGLADELLEKHRLTERLIAEDVLASFLSLKGGRNA